MSTCVKRFGVSVTNGTTTSKLNATSVSLSEGLGLQTAKSLGVKGSPAVFNVGSPKGSVSINGYLESGFNISAGMATTNNNSIGVSAGPYSLPSPCTLTSMNVNITPGEIITTSRTFNYIGALSEVTPPATSNDPVTVATPATVQLAGYSAIGGSVDVKSATWSLSQSYEEIEVMGFNDPIVVYSEGTIVLDIKGESLTNQLTSDTYSSCIAEPKDYTLTVLDCSGDTMGTLSITSGYMQDRGSSAAIDNVEAPGVKIIQFI
jgi:hypothetical protein